MLVQLAVYLRFVTLNFFFTKSIKVLTPFYYAFNLFYAVQRNFVSFELRS
jgi:hypothetical protein